NMKMKRIIVIAVAVLCFTGLFAQENTLLWKISGNGLAKDSYLFGTLHMACAADFRMADKVKETVDKVERIAFEVDLSNPENMTLMQPYIAPNTAFFKDFDPDKKRFIDSVLVENQLPPTIFDQVSPAVVISLLSMKSFECKDMNDIKMMEKELQALENAKGKAIDELESITFQMELLNNLFTPEDLYTYLKASGEMVAFTKRMVKAYFDENVSELEDMMTNTAYLSPEKQELLLSARNQSWLEKMPDMMQTQSYLFAVGAGHLVGEKGVVQLLKDKGYTLTPILD